LSNNYFFNLFFSITFFEDLLVNGLSSSSRIFENSIPYTPLLNIPPFFEAYSCRWDYEVLWNNGHKQRLDIIPLGQFFRLKTGFEIQKIAMGGIKKCSFLKSLGYGEFILKNWNNGDKNGKLYGDA